MSVERFEHRDITPEKRPEYPGPTTGERIHTRMFFDIMNETLKDFDEARSENPESAKNPLSNVEFYFKKNWDNFTEPLLEYDDLKKAIEETEWKSKGEKAGHSPHSTSGEPKALMA